jgi:hypothetical protein
MKISFVVASALLLGTWQLAVAGEPHKFKTFDFTPPDIRTLFSDAEIERLAKLLTDNVEEVNVEAARPEVEATIPSNWRAAPWLFAPRNTSAPPDATAANATVAPPPPYAGQPRPYDR